MASYSLSVRRSAEKELRRIPSKDLVRIVHRIKGLASQPRPVGVETLNSEEGLCRIRQGDYRIIYQVDDEKGEVVIIKIGHRREVYDHVRALLR